MQAVICDLDGTLIANPKYKYGEDLETFYKNILEGYPLTWCKKLLESMVASGVVVIFLTARDQKCEKVTKQQLDSWFDFDYVLYMRKMGDLREDYLMKEEYLQEIKKDYDVLFCLDDNPLNCEMFDRNGVTTLHVIQPY